MSSIIESLKKKEATNLIRLRNQIQHEIRQEQIRKENESKV